MNMKTRLSAVLGVLYEELTSLPRLSITGQRRQTEGRKNGGTLQLQGGPKNCAKFFLQ